MVRVKDVALPPIRRACQGQQTAPSFAGAWFFDNIGQGAAGLSLTDAKAFAYLLRMLRPWACLAIAIVLLGGSINLAHAHGSNPHRAQVEQQVDSDSERDCMLCSHGRLTPALSSSERAPVVPLAWSSPLESLVGSDVSQQLGTGARSPPSRS